jgi:hypothetical protein
LPSLCNKAHDPYCITYFGLFYNPGGPNRKDYNWTIPSKIFNMTTDDCVLIGKDYWDTIGGSGTYESLMEIFQETGKSTISKIKALAES